TRVHDELVRRKLSTEFTLLRDNLVEAVNVLVEIANDKDADSHARIKAAQTIISYVAGKPTERVMLGVGAVDSTPKWMRALSDGIVTLPQITKTEKAEPEVIDVVPVVDDDDEIIEEHDPEPSAPDA